jgi:DNA primase catalytic subunit
MDAGVLLIDVDEITLPLCREEYERAARGVLEAFGYTAVGFAYRLSARRGVHVAVWVSPEPELQYVPLLQYLLGSDLKRECINYERIRRGVDINVLFAGRRRIAGTGGLKCRPELMCPGLLGMVELAKKIGVERVELKGGCARG